MTGDAAAGTTAWSARRWSEGARLYLLPFDHRGSFKKDLFGLSGGREPDPGQRARIGDLKTLIYEGLEEALAGRAPKASAAVLVDEEFGTAVARRARAAGLTLAMPVERSGQEESSTSSTAMASPATSRISIPISSRSWCDTTPKATQRAMPGRPPASPACRTGCASAGAPCPSSSGLRPNELVFDLADPGGVTVDFSAKKPGPRMALEPASCSFRYADSFTVASELEAYERLLHDVMLGDPTLFNDATGIERLWEVAAPLLEATPAPVPYAQGSWGPKQADELLARTAGTCPTIRPAAREHSDDPAPRRADRRGGVTADAS